jgi:O6-methylguanine-DNA--protein-cysteine methyltransferase
MTYVIFDDKGNQVTQLFALQEAAAGRLTPAVREKLAQMASKLEQQQAANRAARKSGTSKAARENAQALEKLLTKFSAGDVITCRQIADVCGAMTPQKAAAIATAGVKAGKLDRLPRENSRDKQKYRVK